MILVMSHHLIMDVISAQIILEDLADVYKKVSLGLKPKLPPKTSSFGKWTKFLQKYTKSKKFEDDISYWKAVQNKCVNHWERPKNGLFYDDFDTTNFKLGKAYTKNLLTGAHKAYNTNINDILLAGLTKGLHNWNELHNILIRLESHGRHQFDELNLSRTVGWFTVAYPVLLSVRINIKNLIQEVKSNLRKIPSKGVSFGLLNFAEDKVDNNIHIQPEIGFNYIGQINQLSYEGFAFSPRHIPESVIYGVDDDLPLFFSMRVVDGDLNINIRYATDILSAEDANNIGICYVSALHSLIDHCLEQTKTIFTPSDFPLLSLTRSQLDKLSAKFQMQDIYPLTPPQSGMFYHSLLNPDDKAYNCFTAIEIMGDLDEKHFVRVLNTYINQLDILRTTFIESSLAYPIQIVLRGVKLPYTYIDLSSFEKRDIQEEIERIKQQLIEKTFKLNDGNVPYKFVLIRLSREKLKLFFYHHHILLDGWSSAVLFGELVAYGNKNEKESNFSMLSKPQFKDYVQWLITQDQNKALQYWNKYLEGYENNVSVLGKRMKKNALRSKGELKHSFGKKVSFELYHLAKLYHTTPFTIIQLIWAVLLSYYNRSFDVVFGLVVSGRPPELREVESIIGMMVTTLPVRVTFKPQLTFDELIKSFLSDTSNQATFQYCSLADIQASTSLGNQLFDHILEFDNLNSFQVDRSYATKVNFRIEESQEDVHYDMNVRFRLDKQLMLNMIFDANLYDQDLLTNLPLHLENVLHQLSNNQFITLDQIDLASISEKEALQIFNNTERSIRSCFSIDERISEQVEVVPYKIAVEENDKLIDYKTLGTISDKFAAYLRNHGVQNEMLVPLMANRSIEFLLAMLGIMKAGGVYVPLEPEDPPARLSQILQDLYSPILMVSADILTPTFIEWLDKLRFIRLILCIQPIAESKKLKIKTKLADLNDVFLHSANQENYQLRPESLAYTIFTSGSTGAPKGVMIEHAGMLNHLEAKINLLSLQKESIISQNASHTFDISIWQFLAGLIAGAKVIIYDNYLVRNPELFVEKLIKDQASILEVVPSFLSIFLNQYKDRSRPILPYVSFLLVTGENLSSALVKRWYSYRDHGKLINAYGPTEASDDVTHFVTDELSLFDIPIGKPIQNLNIHILDDSCKPCPIGVFGELFVSGLGVGRGYLNNPEKTNNLFLTNILKNKRLYKTGDYGFYKKDGNVVFKGRVDFQVKIRGQRAELGEIERIIKLMPEVDEAVVKYFYESKLLVSYIKLFNLELNTASIKEWVKKNLPEFMVPQQVVLIDTFPLTRNGKIDRRQLKEPEHVIPTTDFSGPTTTVQKELAKMWKNILEIENIDIRSNFFELGGHSLKAMQLVAQIEQVFDVKVDIREIFDSSSIAIQEKLINQKLQIDIQKQWESVAWATEYLWSRIKKNFDSKYNLAVWGRIHGEFSTTGLKEGLDFLWRNNSFLRKVFKEDDNSVLISKTLSRHENTLQYLYYNDDSGIDKFEHQREKMMFFDYNQIDEPLIKVMISKLSPKEQMICIVASRLLMEAQSLLRVWKCVIALLDKDNNRSNSTLNYYLGSNDNSEDALTWTRNHHGSLSVGSNAIFVFSKAIKPTQKYKINFDIDWLTIEAVFKKLDIHSTGLLLSVPLLANRLEFSLSFDHYIVNSDYNYKVGKPDKDLIIASRTNEFHSIAKLAKAIGEDLRSAIEFQIQFPEMLAHETYSSNDTCTLESIYFQILNISDVNTNNLKILDINISDHYYNPNLWFLYRIEGKRLSLEITFNTNKYETEQIKTCAKNIDLIFNNLFEYIDLNIQSIPLKRFTEETEEMESFKSMIRNNIE